MAFVCRIGTPHARPLAFSSPQPSVRSFHPFDSTSQVGGGACLPGSLTVRLRRWPEPISTFAGLNTVADRILPPRPTSPSRWERSNIASTSTAATSAGTRTPTPTSRLNFWATPIPKSDAAPGARTATTPATPALPHRLQPQLSTAARQRLQPVDHGEANHGAEQRPQLYVRGHQQRRGYCLDLAGVRLVCFRIRP